MPRPILDSEVGTLSVILGSSYISRDLQFLFSIYQEASEGLTFRDQT